MRGGYRNGWLLLALVLGSLITFADGAITGVDWKQVIEEPLTHESVPAAILFGVVTLVPVLLYAAAQKASASEGVLLWYMLGATAYTRDFGYLQIPGIPLYVTDYVLAFLLVRTFLWPRLRWYPLRSIQVRSMLLLVAVGLVASVRGLLGGEAPVFVARDFMMVGYALFIPLGFALLNNWDSIKRVLLMAGLGSLMLCLNGLGWFLVSPGGRRYINYPVLLAGAFMGFLLASLNRVFPGKTGWLCTAAAGLGLLLADARTEFAAILAAMALMFLLGPSVKQSSVLARFKALAAFAIIAVVLLGIFMQTNAGEEFVARVSEETVSGLVRSSDDPTAQFRLLAWAEAMDRFAHNPLLGEGYGIPFEFDIYEQDPRPHNTYLTFLYKTGVVGFGVLAVVLAAFFVPAFRAVRQFRSVPESVILYALTLALVAVSVAGVFTFVFESPFVAAPYWLFLGMGWRAAALLRKDSAGARIAA